MPLCSHVRAGVDALGRILRDSDLETLGDGLENLVVFLRAHKRDTETLCTKSTSTTDTVKVCICVLWQVVVDGEIDLLDINTTTEHICSDADTLVEVLEFLVALDTARTSVSVLMK